VAVRNIPKNYLVVTGGHSSHKNTVMNGFEGTLEPEYMLLLDFDEIVESYDEQPVVVPVPGVPAGYTPDVLVRYFARTGKPPKLVEVKRTDYLEAKKEEYAPKFAAAEAYCARVSWDFHIATEVEIRTPRLKNCKFLSAYRNYKPDEQDIDRVLDTAEHLGDAAANVSIVEALSKTDDDRLYWIPIVWHCVVQRWLLCDLDTEFADEVLMYLPEDK